MAQGARSEAIASALCPSDHIVAPDVPPVSVHQCQQSVLISAMCQCPSVPHISAYQCTSMPNISDHRSCLSMSPISATYQCQSVHLSVLPISARQC
ncbi:unnamed protein product, partial [Staurois parvus]